MAVGAGLVVALTLPLLLIAMLVLRRERRRFWSWSALVVINVALLGTLTRNAWVGLVVTLLLYTAVRAPRWLLAVVPAAVLFALLAPRPLVERAVSITDLQDRSNYDRLCMLKAGMSMVAERPWFGMGPEMVERRYAIYRPPSAPRYEVPHLHNSFVELAAERGIPELLGYLAMLAATAGVAWRRYVREGRDTGPRSDLYVGVLLALLAFNVAGLFEQLGRHRGAAPRPAPARHPVLPGGRRPREGGLTSPGSPPCAWISCWSTGTSFPVASRRAAP